MSVAAMRDWIDDHAGHLINAICLVVGIAGLGLVAYWFREGQPVRALVDLAVTVYILWVGLRPMGERY